MAFTLNNNLKLWADKYETADFIQNDPVQIPHRYKGAKIDVEYFGESIRPDLVEKANIEISAFVTSWIAFGNRKTIIAKADFIDRTIFEGHPFAYIVGEKWREYKDSPENFYRFFKYADFHNLCERLLQVYTDYLTMEDAIQAENKVDALKGVQTLFGDVEGIPNETSESACKRLCLFLRWMCRTNSPVDFGIWSIVPVKNLIIPLDTHVHQLALNLGIIERKTADIITAIEITDRFAEIFPNDPARGDFALFGFEVDPDAPKKAKVKQTVSEMSIADVLVSKDFFKQCETELTRIWDERETARKKAEKDGLRLKAHPIESLHRDGYFEAGKFIVAYSKITDKVLIGMPGTQREVIKIIGDSAFHKTVQLLIEKEAKNEKKGNRRNRKSNK